MPDQDLDRLMRDYYADEEDRAPDRLAARIRTIPDVEPEPAPAVRRWLRRVAWWRDDRPTPSKNGRHRTVKTAAVLATAILVIAIGALALTERFSTEPAPVRPAEERSGPLVDSDLTTGFMEARSATLVACTTNQGLEPQDSRREVDAGEDVTSSGRVSVWTLSSSGSIHGEDEPRLEGAMIRVQNQGWSQDGNGRELAVQRNAFRIGNRDGSWEGTSTRFSGNRAVPEMAPEVVTLTGAGAYAGMTAILQLPASDDRPECFDVYGIVVEGGLQPIPQPYRDDPVEIPVLEVPVEIALRDDGFGEAAEVLVLEPGEQTIVAFNVGDRGHGFIIEDAAGRVLVGGPDDVIPPGERREYRVDLPASPGGYVLYDPLDRASTETVIRSAE
jgi:hypothetical protein